MVAASAAPQKGNKTPPPEGHGAGRRDIWLINRHDCSPATNRPAIQFLLLDPSAPALDQNDQHDDKEYTSYSPDNRGGVHFKSPIS